LAVVVAHARPRRVPLPHLGDLPTSAGRPRRGRKKGIWLPSSEDMLGKSGAAVLHELMRHSSMRVMDFYANVDDALQAAIVRLT